MVITTTQYGEGRKEVLHLHLGIFNRQNLNKYVLYFTHLVKNLKKKENKTHVCLKRME